MKLADLPDLASRKPNGRLRVRASTTAQYRTAMNSLLLYLKTQRIYVTKLSDLNAGHVAGYHEWLRGRRNITIRSANSYRRSLTKVFKEVGRADLSEELKQLKPLARSSKAMKDEHVAKLLLYASVRDALMICLIRDSGIRRGAIPSITHEDVLIYGKEGRGDRLKLVARTEQKGDTTILAMGRHETAALYLRWKAIQELVGIDSGYVFTTEEGGVLSPNTISGIFQTLKKRARLPQDSNIFAHALRHRFAQKMLSEYDYKVVSQWLGHSSVVTTMEIYGHRSQEELIDLYFGEGEEQRL